MYWLEMKILQLHYNRIGKELMCILSWKARSFIINLLAKRSLTAENTAMVWCGMVWYGMVWRGMVWCGMVWCGMVWYSIV